MSTLRLASTTFPADHHTLVSVVGQHGVIRNIGYGEDVWWVGCSLRSDIHLCVLKGEEEEFKKPKTLHRERVYDQHP